MVLLERLALLPAERLALLERVVPEERFTVLPVERLVVPVERLTELPEVAVLAAEERPAEEEERTAPVPETVLEAERATLVAELRALRAAVPAAVVRLPDAEARVAPVRELEEARVAGALLERPAEEVRLDEPPMASVRRLWVRLLVPK